MLAPRPVTAALAAALALLIGCADGARALRERLPGRSAAETPARRGEPAVPETDAVVWQAAHGREHPLTGRIRDTATGSFVGETELLDHLAASAFVVLGERHDHPDHHALQARVLAGLAARGRRPAVAFEMIGADRGAALAAAAARDGDPAERSAAIREAVAWDASGWPAFPLYAPVFEAALRAGMPLVAANLPSADVAALRRGGAAGLAPDRRAQLGLDAPPDAEERARLAEQIRASHCGYAPEAMLDAMIDVQRAWNAQLARASAEASRAAGGAGAVLVTGGEHARRDHGAPRTLARLAPGEPVVSVVFVEVDPRRPDDDPALAYGDPPPFDYVWYTPRVDLEDACEKYREQLERMRSR